MLWFRIREAMIDSELRGKLEQLGVGVVQQILASHEVNDWQQTSQRFSSNKDLLEQVTRRVTFTFQKNNEIPILEWLTEQYDRAERKETWTRADPELAILLDIFCFDCFCNPFAPRHIFSHQLQDREQQAF